MSSSTNSILSPKRHFKFQTECQGPPARLIFTILGFLGFFNIYAMRVNLSVALVAMVNNTLDQPENKKNSLECSTVSRSDTPLSEPNFSESGKFNWDGRTQALILSSFFYGYVLTQFPGGVLAEKFGAKWLFGGGILVTAVFSLLSAAAANLGALPFAIARFIEGLGEGVTFPAINVMISHWTPKFERSRVSTFVHIGCQIGTVIAMPVSGIMSSSSALGGWQSSFYFFGMLGCLWFVFWAFFAFETPSSHKRITQKELNYILESQGSEISHEVSSIPWKEIWSSVPVWALIITHFGHNWGFLMLLTELPTYLDTILLFNLRSNGFLSALPYLVQSVTACLSSVMADYLVKSGRLSNVMTRQICNSIGVFGPAICFVGVTFSGCRPILILCLITIALGFNGFTFSGFNVTHIDMSPDFSGTLYGITNTAANLPGFLAPATISYFTSEGNTMKEWNYVFLLTAAIYAASGLVYIVFVKAELQPWGLASRREEH